jgi:hypothetical protein
MPLLESYQRTQESKDDCHAHDLAQEETSNTSPSGQVCKPQSKIPICFANIARAEGTLTGTQCKPHAEWRGRPPEATALPLSCAVAKPRHVLIALSFPFA